MIRVVADQNILALEQGLNEQIELVLRPGREIGPADIRQADALLVRSVTRVDEQLLKGSKVSFVGTATSGTDHLDSTWLAKSGIEVAHAAGANANAVVDYVLASLLALVRDTGLDLWSSTVAVVGVGHVGTRLIARLKSLGIDCVGCDPFAQQMADVPYLTLDQALQADVVCLHTPLTRDGPHPTWHMIDAHRLETLAPHAVLLNAGRGEAVDNQALKQHLVRYPQRRTVLDVWENEPAPDAELLSRVHIATPHIAGYSVEAKLAASQQVVEALYKHFELPAGTQAAYAPPPNIVHEVLDSTTDDFQAVPVQKEGIQKERVQKERVQKEEIQQETLTTTDTHCFAEWVLRSFSPVAVSERFKHHYINPCTRAGMADRVGPTTFDELRRELVARREFASCHIQAHSLSPVVAQWLHASGFTLQA